MLPNVFFINWDVSNDTYKYGFEVFQCKKGIKYRIIQELIKENYFDIWSNQFTHMCHVCVDGYRNYNFVIKKQECVFPNEYNNSPI